MTLTRCGLLAATGLAGLAGLTGLMTACAGTVTTSRTGAVP